MRGRKRKPTAVRLLQGGGGHRPLNRHEPRAEALDAQVPAELADPAAIEEWRRITAALAEGHVLTTDRASLIGYCHYWATWQALVVEAGKHALIVRGASGAPMVNPALRAADRAFLVFLRTCSELGLTPSSRARIVALPPASPDDEFSKFQRQRFNEPA